MFVQSLRQGGCNERRCVSFLFADKRLEAFLEQCLLENSGKKPELCAGKSESGRFLVLCGRRSAGFRGSLPYLLRDESARQNPYAYRPRGVFGSPLQRGQLLSRQPI